MTSRVVPNTFAQTVWLYLQLSSTAMGIVCQQAERSRCNCPRQRSAWRCQWRCLPANTEAGMLHVLRHTQKRAFVWGSQNSSRWYEATRSRNQNTNCQAKHFCPWQSWTTVQCRLCNIRAPPLLAKLYVLYSLSIVSIHLCFISPCMQFHILELLMEIGYLTSRGDPHLEFMKVSTGRPPSPKIGHFKHFSFLLQKV